MTCGSEIEDWFQNNFPINNDEYYIEHKQGTNVFTIKKEPDSENNNSEMVLNNTSITFKDFLSKPLKFDLNMTTESEIIDWFLRNFPISIKEKNYIQHKKGSNLFIIKSPRENLKEVTANVFINPEEYLDVHLRFDLDITDENEIENWMAKSIKYWVDIGPPTGIFYYVEHADGSDLFIIRKQLL